MQFSIRRMTPADLPAAMALKNAAGWNQTEGDWRLLLRLQPDGCFVAATDGRPVASATAFCYGRELAWIGMVLTLPEFRGQGLGTRVFNAAVDFCREWGVRTVKLDATPMGLPLYERAGFVAEYEVERWGGVPVSPGGASEELEIGELNQAALTALNAADRAAFGADRAALLYALRQSADWSRIVSRSGRPAGYAMGRPGTNARYFGPCLAEEPEVAATLLDDFIAQTPSEAIFVDVPGPNAEARRLLASCGLEVRRPLVRMCLGPNLAPGNPEKVYGLAGFEFG